MYEKQKEKRMRVKMLRFADEGLGLAKSSNRVKAYTNTVEWLKEIV